MAAASTFPCTRRPTPKRQNWPRAYKTQAGQQERTPGTNGNLCARGLEPLLANQVAQQLIAYDELGAYARDELGISEKFRAPFAGFPFGCMQLCSWSHDATHSQCDRTRGAINSYRLSIIAGSSRSNGRLAARAVVQE